MNCSAQLSMFFSFFSFCTSISQFFFEKEFLSPFSVWLSTCCGLWTKNMLEKRDVEKYLDHSLAEAIMPQKVEQIWRAIRLRFWKQKA